MEAQKRSDKLSRNRRLARPRTAPGTHVRLNPEVRCLPLQLQEDKLSSTSGPGSSPHPESWPAGAPGQASASGLAQMRL